MVVVTQALYVISAIFIITSVLNLYSGNLFLSFFEFVIAALSILVRLYLGKLKIGWVKTYIIAVTQAFVYAVLFNGGAFGYGLFWVMMSPVLTCLVGGQKVFKVCTYLQVFTMGLIIFGYEYGLIPEIFAKSQVLLAILASSSLAIFISFYEKERLRDKNELGQVISELEEARIDAQEAVRAKSEFLAHMSHELRTPLNGVIGMANVLLQGELKDDQKETAEIIQSSGSILLSLINNILDFSSLESGDVVLNESRVSLKRLVEDVARVVAPPAQQKGLEIIVDYDGSIPEFIYADKRYLRQILINLAGNAAKFTIVGHILIRVKALSFDSGKCRLLFEVEDTGVGIPENQRESVFKMFSQSSVTKRSFEGTGLGLTISDKLVQMMGGFISLKSEINKGTTFSFEIKFAYTDSAESHNINLLKNKKILLVEPYLPLAKSLSNYIEILGAEVCTIEWSDIQKYLNPDSGVNAIILGGRDHNCSFEISEEIQVTAKTLGINIYLLRKQTDPLSDSELKNMGATAVITKPVVERDLINRLKDDVDKSVEVAPKVHKERLEVLVVDDNKVNLKVSSHLIRNLGHNVDVVISGREAINAAYTKQYDIIFMDCQMPEIDGFEATDLIRKNEAKIDYGLHVPIVALTANATEQDRQKCLDSGMDNFLSKPIDQNKLREILKQYSRS